MRDLEFYEEAFYEDGFQFSSKRRGSSPRSASSRRGKSTNPREAARKARHKVRTDGVAGYHVAGYL